jgi:gamma-glutamyltranspeptidase/glutathione hydrolase
VEILAEGGTAADAAVAMCLASCVAETVMTGLLGGGHAIWHDGSRTTLLDCFCDVPRAAGEMDDLPMAFGDVEPALRLARTGTVLPPRHAAVLEMLEQAFLTGRGADLYAPAGRRLEAGAIVVQAGLAETMECLVEEGARSAYRGSLAEAMLTVEGVALTWDDLAAYRAQWAEPVALEREGLSLLTRGGLSGVAQAFARLPHLGPLTATERVLALAAALDGPRGPEAHTTNLVAVDDHGRACVLTTSLGLGAGAWTPTFDLHLNSMLGERDLHVGEPVPRTRMASMMAPTLVLGGGLVLAIGAAGGTRLRSALVQVAAGILDEGLEPQAAVDRPRLHPDGDVLHAEPGVDGGALERLQELGKDLRVWDGLHHFFGGVSCVGGGGAAGDPRRDGYAVMMP